MSWLGIDGCRAGWCVVRIDTGGRADCELWAELGTLESGTSTVRMALIDMPIGLVDDSSQPRACDQAARRVLGSGRAASVFAPPRRATLDANDYTEALRINRARGGKGISKQSWNIVPKMREVDAFLRHHPDWQGRLRESHPELCFTMLNHGQPMRYNKKTAEGQGERLAVLSDFLPDARRWFETVQAQYTRREILADDILDALVLAVTAWLGAGRYHTLPASPPRDASGLAMEMVYIRTGTSDE